MHENHIYEYLYIYKLIKYKQVCNINDSYFDNKINLKIKIINNHIDNIKHILQKHNIIDFNNYNEIKNIIINNILPKLLANTDNNVLLKYVDFDNSNFMKVYCNQLGKFYNLFNEQNQNYKSIFTDEILIRLKNLLSFFGLELFKKIGINIITNIEFNNYSDKEKIKFFITILVKLMTFFNNLVHHINSFNILFNQFLKIDDIYISKILSYLE
jgi:hypothetical protein